MRWIGWMVGATLALAAAPAHAELPTVSSGARPGPDALYAPPPAAPQLENVAPYAAPPILISGAEAYRDGELIYQDFLNDDHGAGGAREPDDPNGFRDFLFAPTTGTLTYPTAPVFHDNAADLVELRVKPLPGETAIRVTLNSLEDPERTAFTIAIGGSPEEGAKTWPHGANVRSPAALFLTVHGATAELRDAATGEPRGPAPAARVDLARRQVDVRIPHAAWNPGTQTVRMAAGVGLWDPATGGYLQPEPRMADNRPGGPAPSRAALFNLAFRYDEPIPDVSNGGGGVTIGDAAAGAAVDGSWWRERAQADALRTGDISRFAAAVDFGKLAARTADESRVPRTGVLNRIFASRYVVGQGVDHTKVCFDIAASFAAGAKCEGRFVGQLQPYSLYVPDRPQPAGGWGFTLLLHSLSGNYNQYSGSKNQSQLGDRGAGSLVATPAGRGPDGFYAGLAEADTFEVWADVARHYALDPTWAAVSGYSMGGFGTYRLLARWPDLFARGMSTVGVPGSVDDQLVSLRNTPIMTWAAAGDELVNVAETEAATERLTRLGLRFVADFFPAADHLTLATNDEYGPAAEFLGEHRVDRNPPHVTYVVDTTEDSAPAQTVADHAYWLSGLRARGDGERATVDARSAAFGEGDPPVLGVKESAGTVNGGSRGPQPYRRRSRDWGPAPSAPRANRLELATAGLGEAVVDLARARLDPAQPLELATVGDGPSTVTLAGRFARGTRVVEEPGGAAVASRRVRGGLAVKLGEGRRRLLVEPGRIARRCVSRRVIRVSVPRRFRSRRVTRARVLLRGKRVRIRRAGGGRRFARVSLRGLRKGRYRVVLRLTTSGRRAHVVVRRFRTCAPRGR